MDTNGSPEHIADEVTPKRRRRRRRKARQPREKMASFRNPEQQLRTLAAVIGLETAVAILKKELALAKKFLAGE